MIAINLIPADLRIAMAGRRRMFVWSVAISVGMVALGILWGYEWRNQATARSSQEQINQLHTVLEKVRVELKAITVEAAELQLRIQRADALRSKRAWSGIIALVASCLPSDCWLTSLATEPSAPAGASAKRSPVQDKPSAIASQTAVTIEAPRKLRISGFAVDAAEPHAFVAQLKSSATFTHVALERSSRETNADGSFFRFDVACEW